MLFGIASYLLNGWNNSAEAPWAFAGFVTVAFTACAQTYELDLSPGYERSGGSYLINCCAHLCLRFTASVFINMKALPKTGSACC